MRDGQVILFRHHGQFLLGRHVSGPAGKLQVSVDPDRVARINPHQVVLETDVVLDADEFPAWREECEALMRDLDLAELWDVVGGEGEKLSLEDLATLHWGAGAGLMKRVALQAHLQMESLYFLRRDDAFTARSREEVEALLWQRKQEEESASDEAAFLSWLSGTEPLDSMTGRQEEWLEDLRQFAIMGDAYPGARKSRKLLREVQPGASDWRKLAFTLLVQRGVIAEDEPLDLYRRGIPIDFPPEVLQACRDLLGGDLLTDGHRRDLTSLKAVTIDEASTQDIDDALSLEERPEGYLLGIHIADATVLATPDGAIDAEAARRLLTIYLPERIIPMLPPELSEGLGSLQPGSPRRALSLLINIGPDLEVRDWEVAPSLVRSHARLSYDEADAALEGGGGAPEGDLIRGLGAIAARLREGRLAQGALELSRPDLKVRVDGAGKISVAVTHPTPARRMVAEFMVLANRLLAELCRERDIPTIYRTQAPVNVADLEGVSNPAVWGYQVLRRLRPSILSLEPGPQALLGVPSYLQATSPLRRYLDLVVQRQLMGSLLEGQPFYTWEALAQLLYRVEGQVRELGRVEEERKRYWLLKYLAPLAGQLFQGVVLELRGHEALTELLQFPLRTDIYLTGAAEPGDTVSMRLQEVDLWRLVARFTHATEDA
jgi:exoribonuclease-2